SHQEHQIHQGFDRAHAGPGQHAGGPLHHLGAQIPQLPDEVRVGQADGDPITYRYYVWPVEEQPNDNDAVPILEAESRSDASTISRTVSKLGSGKAYFWKIIAEDAKGGTVESQTRRFETPRGADCLRVESPAHLHDLRHRRARKPALYCHGIAGRANTQIPHRRQTDAN